MTAYEPHPTEPPPGVPPAAAARVPDRRRVLRVELAVVAFVAAVPGFVIGLEGITDPDTISTDVPVLELLAALLAALGPAAIAAHLLWRDGRLEDAGFGRRSAGFVVGYGALGAVCCYLALFTVAIVVGLVLVAFGVELEAVEDDLELSAATILAAGAIALTAGVGEEVVYRAYAMTRMAEAGFSDRAVLFVPWAVFTVVHLYQGPIAVALIGAVAATLVWLYRWQGSIWPVMVAHALFDLVQLTIAAAAS